MSWTDPDTMRSALTGDALPLAWWNAAMDDLLFLAQPPLVAVRLTASQTVADSTDHTITWDEATWSDNGASMWDSLAGSVVTITRDGIHEVVAHAPPSAAGAIFDLSLYVNDTLRIGPVPTQLTIDTHVALDDELKLKVEQTSGASTDLLDTLTRMTVTWSQMSPPNDSAMP